MQIKISELEEELKILKRKNSRNSIAILVVSLSMVVHAIIQLL